jgi:tellurite methyltransferase
MNLMSLADQFGQIDIYLFDQLLKGRITAADRVLDAGCGSGRNLLYLLQIGAAVSAVDVNPAAVAGVRELAAEAPSGAPADHFRVEPVERLSFADASFDVVISSAVLHFARDGAHFDAMVGEMWRVLRPGGMLFARLASPMPRLDLKVRAYEAGHYTYLTSPEQLEELTARLGGQLLDPIKTTVVHGQRAMSTWVVRKSA